MSDYISREAALSPDIRIGGLTRNEWEVAKKVGDEFIQHLTSIPAADVRTVVRGRWTRIDYEPCGHDYECSTCGWKNEMATNFCPNCGADMRDMQNND